MARQAAPSAEEARIGPSAVGLHVARLPEAAQFGLAQELVLRPAEVPAVPRAAERVAPQQAGAEQVSMARPVVCVAEELRGELVAERPAELP